MEGEPEGGMGLRQVDRGVAWTLRMLCTLYEKNREHCCWQTTVGGGGRIELPHLIMLEQALDVHGVFF